MRTIARLTARILDAGVAEFRRDRGAAPVELLVAMTTALATMVVASGTKTIDGVEPVAALSKLLGETVAKVATVDAASPEPPPPASPPPEPPPFVCHGCGAIGDPTAPEATIALCGQCETWHRPAPGGGWQTFTLAELSDGRLRDELSRVLLGLRTATRRGPLSPSNATIRH